MYTTSEAAGVPGILPVMAALTESSMTNNPGGDRDSKGYFQMRAGIWDKGPYLGYFEDPNLQMLWFNTQANKLEGGVPQNEAEYGAFIQRIERSAYPDRYQKNLVAAKALLQGVGSGVDGNTDWQSNQTTPGTTPTTTSAPRLAYGSKPKPGQTYTVRATTFGTTATDDNGIAWWDGRGAYSREVKWLVAELGVNNTPRTNTAHSLGSIPQGSKVRVTYPGTGKSVVAIVGEVGAGAPGASLDIWDDMAIALGLPDKANFNADVQMTLLQDPPITLTANQTANDLPGTGPVGSNGSTIIPVLASTASGEACAPQASPTTQTRYQYPLQQGPYGVNGCPFQGTHADFGNWQSDHAIDLNAPFGTPVVAVGDGSINRISGTSGKWNTQTAGIGVTLSMSGNDVWYGHLSKVYVTTGQQVVAGDIIGLTGSGNGSPHLHIGMHANINIFQALNIAPDAGCTQTYTWNTSITPIDTTAIDGSALNTTTVGGGFVYPNDGTVVSTIINAATSQIGIPYSWGGGSPSGPSTGICGPAGCQALTTVGFDCSSLMQYAYAKAGITIPRTTTTQYAAAQPVSPGQLLPGDMIFVHNLSHVVMYIGSVNGTPSFVEAPQTGEFVQIRPLSRLNGIVGYGRFTRNQ